MTPSFVYCNIFVLDLLLCLTNFVSRPALLCRGVHLAGMLSTLMQLISVTYFVHHVVRQLLSLRQSLTLSKGLDGQSKFLYVLTMVSFQAIHIAYFAVGCQ